MAKIFAHRVHFTANLHRFWRNPPWSPSRSTNAIRGGLPRAVTIRPRPDRAPAARNFSLVVRGWRDEFGGHPATPPPPFIHKFPRLVVPDIRPPPPPVAQNRPPKNRRRPQTFCYATKKVPPPSAGNLTPTRRRQPPPPSATSPSRPLHHIVARRVQLVLSLGQRR